MKRADAMKFISLLSAFLFLAVSPVVADEVAEVPSGPENLFPNSSFEEWDGASAWPETHGGRWSLETEKDEFGRPIFAHVGPTNGPARTGNIALHSKDTHGGAYNNIVRYTLPREAAKPFAGKGLKLSVWAHLISKSASACAGIGVWAECRESPTVSAVADFPRDTLTTDGYVKLSCYLKVPEDVRSLTVLFRCAKEYFGRCEICYDDVELSVIPRESVPETAEERERRLRKPFVPNAEAMEWAVGLLDDRVSTDDGFNRPAIKDGNFVGSDGRFFFPLGPWIGPRTWTDWGKGTVAKHGIDHPAYVYPPGKRSFGAVGINAAQMSGAPQEIGAATTGYVKDLAKTKDVVAKYRETWKELGDTYMTVDFAFGYNRVLKSMNPDLAERIDQRRAGWHEFVPFCPESPEGWKYYETYLSTGARFVLDCGLNVGIWELFNESAYGCECEWNKKSFAEESEKRYGTIAAANAAWGTDFKDFAALARAPDYGRFKGLWNEWCEFLARRYPAFLQDCRRVIQAFDHRPNVYFTEQLSVSQIWDGMTDYRRIADALDLLAIEGGWGYGGVFEKKPKDEMEAVVFAGSLQWYVADYFAALTRGRKPVINNELYCSRTEDGKRVPSREMDLVTSLWLEFFHGVSAAHMYIWEKRSWEWSTFEQAKANVLSPSYKSSALLNPYNWPPDQLGGFGRFLKELERHQDRISEFPRTTAPTVGIFHSQVSSAMARYGRPTKSPMQRAYSALMHSFYPVTFVFDDEIVEGKMPDGIQTIVVPAADFEREDVRVALERFAAKGGNVIVDKKAFSFDEHGNKTGRGVARAQVYNAEVISAAELLACVGRLGIRKVAELVPLDGGDDFGGADVQVIDRGDYKLVLIVNLAGASEPREAKFSLPGTDGAGFGVFDGLTGEKIADDMGNGVELTIPPQERLLLELRKRP